MYSIFISILAVVIAIISVMIKAEERVKMIKITKEKEVNRELLESALTIVVGDTIIKPKFREYPLHWTSKDFEPYSRLVLDYVVENSYHREGISIDFSTMCNDVE